jgi:hypothetical protein
LVESSRASLMLQGLLPSGERTTEDLDRTLIDGRYSEMVMLFYLGKDLMRWIEQCLECAARDPELRNHGLRCQSFADLLVNDPPPRVQQKLRRWGVADYRSIFTRALALNVLFAEVPERETLSNDFIRSYYRYADQIFSCRQDQTPFTAVVDLGFTFELYASGEYSRMLEREWTAQETAS